MTEEIKEIIGEIKDSYYETQPSTKFYKNISLIEEEIERLYNKVDELMTLYTTERNVKEDYKAITDKAIKYLDKFYDEESNHWKYDFDNTNKQELYEILKGIDKE